VCPYKCPNEYIFPSENSLQYFFMEKLSALASAALTNAEMRMSRPFLCMASFKATTTSLPTWYHMKFQLKDEEDRKVQKTEKN
jgi:hypothetical protein